MASYSHKFAYIFANIWSFLVLFSTFLALFGSFQPKNKAIKKPSKAIYLLGFKLWSHLESNQAPTDYESVALTE